MGPSPGDSSVEVGSLNWKWPGWTTLRPLAWCAMARSLTFENFSFFKSIFSAFFGRNGDVLGFSGNFLRLTLFWCFFFGLALL